ncbi:MAG TPA: 1-(5-phosphoribosyl)-5-[(5-phosphoribosylamino)methylideneamino]imidazole-4-carboxamide isomerase [Hellea balneolensis]|uniref:1-(5-phosphoribosyl)-5-[(5-phosphoribosylamino)methylideneamino] imidazole-4-carboxamide isomerase n=1 Tax=Hellea balneolensis TaxID=287478 RepID=A0A7C5R072_9PROT|nr:1-(5-phosphoribosyl)-5-[(5-phosphoribosylamino)methylideneamino]imidazole-4-carboxamide isomerase [Hellea balneolensis]
MIIPAIDLMDGGCVRLLKGDFDQRTDYALDPVKTAQGFADAGAKWLHVVDLDGAKNGLASQSDLIADIAKKVDMQVQTGGGIRESAQIRQLLARGIARVVIGSLAIKSPDTVKAWMAEFGPERIVLALDVFQGLDGVPRPAIHGWTETSEQSLYTIIDDFLQNGLCTILVTDIAKDGALQGANLGLYREIIKRYPGLDLITSGGVGNLEDVKALKTLNPAGIIIGKALYENRFTLTEAITC